MRVFDGAPRGAGLRSRRRAAPGERPSPGMAERQGHLGAVFHRDRLLPWSQWAVFGGLAATCAAAVLALLATTFISDVGRTGVPAGWTTTVIYAGTAGEAPARPVSPGQPARRTQPRAVTLQLTDLPPGA